jgi:pimeloyl-ACP methyl ester carboxylesterase
MRFEEIGEGRPVLFLHGAPSPSTDFLPIARELGPGFRSLIVDLPGYRGVPPLEGPNAFARTQTMLEDALLARGVREVAVVGYSAGAIRAFSLAFSQRIRVTALVSLGGFAGLDQATRDGFRATGAGIRTGQIPAAALPGLFVSPAYLKAHPEVVPVVEGWMNLIPAAALADELDSAGGEAPDLRPRLHELKIPMLAMIGELDLAVSPTWTRELPSYNPAIETEIIPGAGHALLFESPGRVVAGIRRTLSR